MWSDPIYDQINYVKMRNGIWRFRLQVVSIDQVWYRFDSSLQATGRFNGMTYKTTTSRALLQSLHPMGIIFWAAEPPCWVSLDGHIPQLPRSRMGSGGLLMLNNGSAVWFKRGHEFIQYGKPRLLVHIVCRWLVLDPTFWDHPWFLKRRIETPTNQHKNILYTCTYVYT